MVRSLREGDRRTAPCHLALLTDELIYSRPVESGKFELRLHARIPIEPASTSMIWGGEETMGDVSPAPAGLTRCGGSSTEIEAM